ncbi:MAG: hypothetical protein GX799_00100 [Crenarchaeota archaeon]|nr:hypothetical protein [Thermoproteota archaeon]
MVSKEIRALTILVGIGLIIVGFYIGMDRTVEIQTDYKDNYQQHGTMTTTATVRGDPNGYILDGVGAVVIISGLLMHTNSYSNPKFSGNLCGQCKSFGNEACKRHETYNHALPCNEFKSTMG